MGRQTWSSTIASEGYWKRSLVDDLGRLIDVGKLNGREMCRVVRTLYDYLDVEQFAELLERMGR